jgi:hypothetical protein
MKRKRSDKFEETSLNLSMMSLDNFASVAEFCNIDDLVKWGSVLFEVGHQKFSVFVTLGSSLLYMLASLILLPYAGHFMWLLFRQFGITMLTLSYSYYIQMRLRMTPQAYKATFGGL